MADDVGILGDFADSPLASYERHPVDDLEPEAESPFAAAADFLRAILLWQSEAVQRNGRGRVRRTYYSVRRADVRATVTLYALRPDLMPGETSVTLARKLGITKQAFSKVLREFKARFKIQTRVMRSDAARESMRKAMIASHARRRLHNPPCASAPVQP